MRGNLVSVLDEFYWVCSLAIVKQYTKLFVLHFLRDTHKAIGCMDNWEFTQKDIFHQQKGVRLSRRVPKGVLSQIFQIKVGREGGRMRNVGELSSSSLLAV
jgi:hypothetical protein